MNPDPAQAPPTATARCQAHQAAAETLCQRCGAFLCERCRKWWSERPVCEPCRRWYVAAGPSRQSVWALGLVTAGFVLALPGVVGLVVAHRELARARRGESSETSRSYASLARTLGWCQIAVIVLVVLVLALRRH